MNQKEIGKKKQKLLDITRCVLRQDHDDKKKVSHINLLFLS